MTEKNRYQLGCWGERKAKAYLQKKEYLIREMNFNLKIGEIDLIAQKNNFIVFIEVKTRRTKSFGPPQAAVDERKKFRIRNVARAYLANSPSLMNLNRRFDVITVFVSKQQKISISHFKNAF